MLKDVGMRFLWKIMGRRNQKILYGSFIDKILFSTFLHLVHLVRGVKIQEVFHDPDQGVADKPHSIDAIINGFPLTVMP